MAERKESGFKFGWFTAGKGHRLRFGRAEASEGPAKGLVLLLNGRSEFMEKYAEVAQGLTARGYTVLSLDWRGQGLSVRELENRQKGYVATFDDYLTDLDLFYDHHVKGAGLPVTILAHSMGGHLALRFMHANPMRIDRAVLVSPMVDIVTAPFPRMGARAIANIACASGFAESYVLGGCNYTPETVRFETNRLTHDREQFENEKALIAENPDLALGDVTYSWVKAAFDSIETLSGRGYARRIKTPVMMVSAREDRVVSVKAQKRLFKNMSGGEFVSIPGAFHEILHETDAIREVFWNHFDGFTSR
ncbi:MAG: alpha/beta hydrolase [Desulfobacteraceae bacterium]|nr:alpha/beta hydrolase [Desulfobacteraceae bacterium]